MIILTRKKFKETKKKSSFTGRSYRNYNKEVFQDMILNADWSCYDNKTTVAGKWQEMVKIINNVINTMCPLKTFNIKQVKEPWITALLELIKDKDIAMKEEKKKRIIANFGSMQKG